MEAKATLGELACYFGGGTDGKGKRNGPFVVLLHGFGAPGDDLYSLWPFINVPEGVRFAFPVAPLTLNYGEPEARAWWMLDLEHIARDRASGKGRNVHEVPQGLEKARHTLLSCLMQLTNQFDISFQNIILGGFSQGAMLACDTILRSTQEFGGLIFMSGTLIAKDEWLPLLPRRKGLKVFQSHGVQDPLLPLTTAKNLRDYFIDAGLDVQWQEFAGGHEIPVEVLEQVGDFIQRCVNPTS